MAPPQYEGPQTVSPENFDETVVMVDRCFRPHKGSMGTQYPLLLLPNNGAIALTTGTTTIMPHRP